MSPRPPFETLEGVVKSINANSLWFREDGAGRDICIPLSQVRDGLLVKRGDNEIDVTKWILDKLEEEGRR